MNNYSNLESLIGYKFNNIDYLETALTHKSYANECFKESYERFEFLGDAIIEFIVSNYIIKIKELNAGDLSKLRASLVSTDYLYNISISLGLDKLVYKSKSLNILSKKNTADLFESLIGAVYLDSGLEKAKEIIEKFIIVDDNNISNIIKNSKDYKTLLQEKMQSLGIKFEYKLFKTTGKDHDKTFVVRLIVNNEIVIEDSGKSIQSAEELCAKKYLGL